MTTPQTFSPNVRILTPEASLPADAPKSDNPLAEAALAELLQGGRLGIRDMYRPVDALPEIITDDARSKWDALAEDVADGTESARMLLADWWRHGWAQTFQRPPFWVRPAAAPDPGAHPYPGAAPVAETEPELTAAALEPLPGLKSPELPLVPPAEPEPAAGEPAPTDATAVLLSMAKPGEEGEPAAPEVTTVLPVTEAPTEAVPVIEADGGDEK